MGIDFYSSRRTDSTSIRTSINREHSSTNKNIQLKGHLRRKRTDFYYCTSMDILPWELILQAPQNQILDKLHHK